MHKAGFRRCAFPRTRAPVHPRRLAPASAVAAPAAAAARPCALRFNCATSPRPYESGHQERYAPSNPRYAKSGPSQVFTA
jgi:hypothetical protein